MRNPRPGGHVATAVNRATRSGQTLIESCVVIAVVALLLFGILQLSQLLAAREIVYHAAARGARAKTVGFNDFMVSKVVDVAVIPNAGHLIVPPYTNDNPVLRTLVASGTPGDIWDYALHTVPVSAQGAIEAARIPEYLAAENHVRARYILDYDDWNHISHWSQTGQASANAPGALISHVQVRQAYRLWVPMHRAFYDSDSATLSGEAYIEAHYPLYLTDMNW